VWWVGIIFQIGLDYGTTSLRRRSGWDLKVVDRRKTELMRMLLLQQRARGRRKGVLGGTLVKSDVTTVTGWGTLLLSVQRRRRRGNNRRGLIQQQQQLWRTFRPSLIWNSLWSL